MDERAGKKEGRKQTYFVAARLITDILDIAVDVVHGVGLGGDVLLGGAGGGFVHGGVGHVVLVDWLVGWSWGRCLVV